jgi:hypothetical protein
LTFSTRTPACGLGLGGEFLRLLAGGGLFDRRNGFVEMFFPVHGFFLLIADNRKG